MELQMKVLNIGFGTMEGTPWAKAEIQSDEVESVDDGQRVFKGVKTAKLNIASDNDFQVVRRFARETFPATFTMTTSMSIVGGKTQLKILDFKSNQHGK